MSCDSCLIVYAALLFFTKFRQNFRHFHNMRKRPVAVRRLYRRNMASEVFSVEMIAHYAEDTEVYQKRITTFGNSP